MRMLKRLSISIMPSTMMLRPHLTPIISCLLKTRRRVVIVCHHFCVGVTTLRVRLCVTCLMAHRMRLSIRIARSVAKKSTLTAIRTLISGDGIAYYTCDTAANDRHRVRSCTRDFTNGSGVTNTCGDGFRRCVGPKKDHNWSDWINWETKHSDDDDDSTEETTQNEFQEPTSEPTPAPSYHMCGSHETWQSGDHSAAGCGYSGHYVCDGSDHSYTYCYVTDANGNTCTVGGYYACQSHMHQYPEPQSQYMTCAYGHTYDTTVQSQVDFHRTKTCKWCGGTWKDCGDVTPYCPTWTTAHHKCSEPSHTCDLCD